MFDKAHDDKCSNNDFFYDINYFQGLIFTLDKEIKIINRPN